MAPFVKLLVNSEPLGPAVEIPAAAAVDGAQAARYRFLVEQNGLLMNAGVTTLAAEAMTIATWTRDTQSKLKQRMEEMTASHPPSFAGYVMELGSIGAVYFNALIPDRVKEYIRGLPSQPPPYVYIYAENHWVPWELVYDPEEGFFWGDKCIVVRVPMLKYSATGISRSVQQTRQTPLGSVVNVVGDEVVDSLSAGEHSQLALDALAARASKFSGNFQAGAWSARTVEEVRVQAADASILHFTCHGRFDADDGYYLQLCAAYEHPSIYRLGPLKVQSHIRLNDTLVFANACTSDVPALHYGTFYNLGQQFFERGAGAFIGTIAPVPIERAVRLADIFYGNLLAGNTVGMALHRAKQAMKQEQNPFYLFYCLYGNAFKRFKLAR